MMVVGAGGGEGGGEILLNALCLAKQFSVLRL